MEVVGGSIPLATTKSLTDGPTGRCEPSSMFKLLGSTVELAYPQISLVILSLKAIY